MDQFDCIYSILLNLGRDEYKFQHLIQVPGLWRKSSIFLLEITSFSFFQLESGYVRLFIRRNEKFKIPSNIIRDILMIKVTLVQLIIEV